MRKKNSLHRAAFAMSARLGYSMPSRKPPRDRELERRSQLDCEPSSVGVEWALTLCETTRKEGRLVAGGWPGTLPEARLLVGSRLNDHLAARHLEPLSESELGAATNVAYARARQEWLDVARALRHEARRQPMTKD